MSVKLGFLEEGMSATKITCQLRIKSCFATVIEIKQTDIHQNKGRIKALSLTTTCDVL